MVIDVVTRTASKVVIRSKRSEPGSFDTSCTSNETFVRPQLAASARPFAIASSEKPVKRLFGHCLAITLMACPDPQPMSATSIPSSSFETMPETSGICALTRL